MAEWSAEVFQNEYLPAGADEMHAVVAITCSGAGVAGGAGTEVGEIIIVDTSGSMSQPSSKIRAARQAAQVAIDEIVDGAWFAIIAGTDHARLAYPEPSVETPMVRMDHRRRSEAKAAVRGLETDGGTAIGSWLSLASEVFRASPATQRHAILLTDGRNESEQPSVLRSAVADALGLFQCDCRGVGADWNVEELRTVSSTLLGTVDLIANPDDMEADFEAMMRAAMGRGIADARLRVWAPRGAEVLFVRQVAPAIDDLTDKREVISDLVGSYPTGSWGDESREYHIAIRLPSKPLGTEQLAARAQLVIGDQIDRQNEPEIAAQGLVKAIWSDDQALTTRINAAVAHYTGQTELAQAIQEGLAARAAGDDVTATHKLGRAVQLAHQTNNDEATARLKKVVDIEEADAGTVRLRRDVAKLDEMALDTRSTKTTRVR